MDDLDVLDSKLFGKSLTHSKTFSVDESKKRVMFKDVDDKDPLDDLNSSDDDFQESSKENPAPLLKDSKIANLFGIKPGDSLEIKDSIKHPDLIKLSIADDTITKSLLEQQQESILKELDFPSSTSNVPKTALKPANSVQKNVSQMNNDCRDIAHNLLDKPKLSPTNLVKKSSLMEDLFGSWPRSSPSIDTSRRKNLFAIDVAETHSNPGELATGLLNDKTNKMSNAGFSLSATKEPRSGRRSSVIQNDPLGLLSSSFQVDETPKPEEKTSILEIAPKSPDKENLPEWLGGSKVLKEQKPEIGKVRNEDLSTVKSIEISGRMSSTINLPASEIENISQSNLASKLLSMEFDQQTAIINIQQQEHELRTAALLSQQSEKLNYLLESQKSKLLEQEKQFNVLISRQLERQTLLETQIKAQQNRIDSYIKTLTAQPISVLSINDLAINKNIEEDSKEAKDKEVELESLLHIVQHEKIYLEKNLESLREKHEREISILENSYKKQIQFLKEAMVQMEKRLQDDIECLEADYKLKIEKLKEEMSENNRIHKAEKETIKEVNLRLLDEIQKRHSKSLQILQQEYSEIIERITKSKESERQAIELMRIDGTNIENVFNKSQIIIENLEVLQKKFESRNTCFTESQDNHLITQEKNIEYLKGLLEKQKDSLAEEKQKLMIAVDKLEGYSTELIEQFQKQNASFKENEEILKSREQALFRDREIFVEQTNWERERLQAMRDSLTKEEDRQLEWLAQERQTLITERGKLQIFNRLKTGEDEFLKIELEATIKAAQDAAANANHERLKWKGKINELDIQQRILQQKENQLIQKAQELQDFTQSALAKKEEGLLALKEARFLEERYKEKFNRLQLQQEILTERENKLAVEKLELARERLSCRVSVAEKPEEETISKIDRPSHDEPSMLAEAASSIQCETYFKDIIDPRLLLLEWNLDSKV